MNTYGDLYQRLREDPPRLWKFEDIVVSKLLWVATRFQEAHMWEVKDAEEGYSTIIKIID